MNSTELKAAIDLAITSETAPASITPTDVGVNLKSVVDYVVQEDLLKEVLINKSTNLVTDGASDTKYPSVKSVKTYVDANVGGGFTVYSALISQSGAAAPTQKILKNTTGVTFTYSRNSNGSYSIIASSNVFTADKTASIYSLNSSGSYSNAIMNFWHIGATFFSIETLNSTTPTDGIMTDTFIEIRIYS